MNNLEEFYNNKRLLELIETYSQRNIPFSSINIELKDGFIKAIKPEEAGDIKYMILTWLDNKREEIENHLIDKLKTRLEESKERVKRDFEEVIKNE